VEIPWQDRRMLGVLRKPFSPSELIDRVTHFAQISVNPGAAQQTIRVKFKWTADSTGQSGAAYDAGRAHRNPHS